jgi:hypothetical protein
VGGRTGLVSKEGAPRDDGDPGLKADGGTGPGTVCIEGELRANGAEGTLGVDGAPEFGANRDGES